MKQNLTFRRVIWSLYLLFALILDVIYTVLDILGLSHAQVDLTTRFLAASAALLTFLISLGLFIFGILYFKYRTRNLLWLLVPLVGGISFAVRALASKKEPSELQLSAKAWSIWVVLGLFLLDQTTGSAVFIFSPKHQMAIWQVLVSLLLFIATIAYFIYWGKKRQVAQWSWRNIWRHKIAIVLTFILMFALTALYTALLHALHITLPTGSNQQTLNEMMKHIPAWLMWLQVAIGAPVMEESIFRVGIFELISPKHPRLALFLSAFLFALAHMLNASIGDWRVWLVYLIMGFCLAGLYYKTRKVEASATVHFLWNGILTYLT